MVRTLAIPQKTQRNTKWIENTWCSWAPQRVKGLSAKKIESGNLLLQI